MKILSVVICLLCSMVIAEEQSADKDPSVIAARKSLREVREKNEKAQQSLLRLKTERRIAQSELDKANEEMAALDDAHYTTEKNGYTRYQHVDNDGQVRTQIRQKIDAAQKKLEGSYKLADAEKVAEATRATFDQAEKALRDALEPYAAARTKTDKVATKTKNRLFKLVNGEEWEAVSVMESEDSYTVKDSDGNFKTFKKSEIVNK